MNIFLSGISLLFLWLAWKFVWQPTLLDTSRDQLCDLMDQTRAWFLENGYNLDNPACCELRHLLNNQLQMAEAVTFSGYLIFSHFESSRKNAGVQAEITNKREFAGQDADVERFIKNIRQQACQILACQMLFRNFFLALFFIIYAICFVIWFLLKEIIGMAMPQHFFKTCSSTMMGAILAFLTLVTASPIFGDRMEEYSLAQPGYMRGC